MSEREEAFLERAEALCQSMEKAKKWFWATTTGFAIAFVSFIALSAVGNYRLGEVEKLIPQAVSRAAIVQLDEIYKAQTNAIINLAEKDYQEALKKFENDCSKIRSNIIMFNSEIKNSRSGKSGGSGGSGGVGSSK